MIQILLIVLVVYLLGVVINYARALQDMEKFSVVSASIMSDSQTVDSEAEKIQAKWLYAFVAFLGALVWPVLLINKFRRKGENN